MGGELDALVAGKPPQLVAAARLIAGTIEGSAHELHAAIKWGALTYALGDDFHHWICSVGVTRKRANLTFHFGGILEDPRARFVAGSSQWLRRLEYVDVVGVDPDEVLGFLDQAEEKYPWFREHWRELA